MPNKYTQPVSLILQGYIVYYFILNMRNTGIIKVDNQFQWSDRKKIIVCDAISCVI
jgi:hypothetical protein